ncbi:MAG: hypothetical protein K0R83_2969 [Caulobacter sp.]|jgi:hypothetical protein|nr:hypothetical protein [Caulobacter sp.]
MSSESSPEAVEAAPAQARPFVLTFTAPPAMPWDQWRLVKLEAQHGAPLPEDEVRLSLRRLDPWRPGREGRFAAAYFRREEVTGEVRHTEMLDGEPIEFILQDRLSTRKAAWERYLPLACVAVAALVAVGAATLALQDRERADATLDEQYRSAVRARSLGEQTQRRFAEQRALVAVGAQGRQLADVMEDIGWLARARAPNAVLGKVEWRPSGLVVETTGPTTPIVSQDRQATLIGGSDGRSRWRVTTAETTPSTKGSAP